VNRRLRKLLGLAEPIRTDELDDLSRGRVDRDRRCGFEPTVASARFGLAVHVVGEPACL
jgi:hypothetical protein